MTKHIWCSVCNGRILNIDEEQKGVCGKCVEHEKKFHRNHDIKEEDNKEE